MATSITVISGLLHLACGEGKVLVVENVFEEFADGVDADAVDAGGDPEDVDEGGCRGVVEVKKIVDEGQELDDPDDAMNVQPHLTSRSTPLAGSD